MLLEQAPEPIAATPAAEALLTVGRWLADTGYCFTTVTPATHARVLSRDPGRSAMSPRDVFGWSLPFRQGLLPAHVVAAMKEAGVVEHGGGGLLRSRIRCSALQGMLLFHSAYPTLAADSVFFGPDTYRFAALIRDTLATQRRSTRCRIVDLGCGSGAGGLLAARLLRPAARVILADINPRALELGRVNAALAGVEAECVCSDVLGSIDGSLDLVLANPPYLADEARRTYRDGGGRLGEGLSLRIVRETLPRLAPAGQLILYSASAIVDGRDLLRAALEPLLRAAGAWWSYTELDPDVFGEELDTPAYAQAERIAVVALVARRPGLEP